MSKKAYLVTFEVTTRIIEEESTDNDGLSDDGIRRAWIQAKETVAGGFWGDHYCESIEDKEMPYDPKTDKEDGI